MLVLGQTPREFLMTHWSIFIEFAVLSLIIGTSGYFLSLYGDVIAEKTGLGGTWIGFTMLGTVTSLPELVTGVSAVTYVGVPNIALGDALGSCVFNLLVIVLLDFLHRGASVYTRISQGHILSAGFGVVLLGFVAFNIVLYQHEISLSLGHIGLYTPIIVLFYIFAVRTVFRYEKAQRLEVVEEIAERYPKISLAKALTFYFLAAAVVVLMAGNGRAFGRYHGLAPQFCGHRVRGFSHLPARSRCHSIGIENRGVGHGHQRPVGEQPVRLGDYRCGRFGLP